MMEEADLMAARRVLGWAPNTSFRELVQMMDADVRATALDAIMLVRSHH